MFALIGTWEMSLEGMKEASLMLQNGEKAGDAAVHAVMRVEDEPSFMSVGYGGLPDRDGHVKCDAAYMNGDTLRFGAIMSAEGIRNPVLAARALCGRETDCLLAGRGAEEFAIREGLAMRDMRTKECMEAWREKVKTMDLSKSSYKDRGHDTVCVLCLDNEGHMRAATSTSGLFMKEPGRVGDTPVIGSGFYCDSDVGAAAATGMGEEIMRGCLSYEIVSLMRRGMDPMRACREAVEALRAKRERLGDAPTEISVIALDRNGSYGAATTLNEFPYVAAKDGVACLYTALPEK